MKRYIAYITPRANAREGSNIMLTKSRLEKSAYLIEGYRPSISEIILIKGIPKSERKFYKLIWNTFNKKPFVLEEEVKNLCEKYNFRFEKLDEA